LYIYNFFERLNGFTDNSSSKDGRYSHGQALLINGEIERDGGYYFKLGMCTLNSRRSDKYSGLFGEISTVEVH